MKVLSISGTQGSGKTTLIRELIARIGAKGSKSAGKKILIQTSSNLTALQWNT
jgi:molybdopterin-guanine dinucleotide biosynthesis protein